MEVTASALRETMKFVARQSYEKHIVLGADDNDNAPAVPGLAPGARKKLLGRGAWRSLSAGEAGDDPLAAAEAILYGALGMLRNEPLNLYNHHKAIPSARSAFMVDGWLVTSNGCWHHEPARHAWEPVAGASLTLVVDWPVTVALAACYERAPAGYGELRYALSVLEAGHAAAAMVTICRLLGLESRVHTAFPDAELLAVLGLGDADGWIPAVMVEAAPRLAAELTAPDAATTVPVTSAGPSSFDRLGWLSPDEVEDWRNRAPLMHTVRRRGAMAVDYTAHPNVDSLYLRNSGRGVVGLCARLNPIPAEALTCALASTLPALATPGPGAGAPSAAGLRLLCAVERVSGLDDGLWEYRPESHDIVLLRRGRLLADVQAAFSYGPDSLSVATMNVAVFMCVDYGEIVSRFGPRGVRLANLELGGAAQNLAASLAGAGLFARPCRSYHEQLLDRILPLAASECVAYEVLVGANRFQDAILDMRL